LDVLQPDAPAVRERFDRIVLTLREQFPEVSTTLKDAGDGLLVFSAFPELHWRKIWSTNPLERLSLSHSGANASTSATCMRWSRGISHRPLSG